MTQEAKSENGATAWSRPARITVTVIFILTPFVILWLTRPFWLQLAVAGILAALLRPVAAFLQRRLRFPRALALAVSILLLLVLVALCVLAIPVLFSALAQVLAKLSEIGAGLSARLVEFLGGLSEIQVGGVALDLAPLTEPIIDFLDRSFLELLQESPDEALEAISGALARFVGAVASMISLLSATMFTVFFTIYLITDVSWIHDGVDRLIPAAHRHEWAILARRLVRIWETYVFGQLGVMAAVGAMITVVAWLIGLPYPLALGFLAGVLEIIPTMGPVLAAIPAVLLALFVGSTRFVDLPNALFAGLTALSYYGVVLIDDNLVTPNIHGHVLDLPPLVVLLGVLVGVHQFGLLGGVLALPVLVSLREIYIYLHAKVQGLDPFPEPEAGT
jgi:predicted PurR-regulated permease PerM